jgi:hypothetical protein
MARSKNPNDVWKTFEFSRHHAAFGQLTQRKEHVGVAERFARGGNPSRRSIVPDSGKILTC